MIEYGAHWEFGILFFPYLMINLVTINQFTSSIVSFCGISCINQPYNINVLQPPRAEVSAIGDGDKDIRIDCIQFVEDLYQPFCSCWKIIAFLLVKVTII